MFVKSLQVGKGVVREFQDMKVETACFKLPFEGALHLGREGFLGDQQVDRVNHGGPDKAVLVYSSEHHSHWENFLGREPGAAAFGENLTVEGVTEESACIGDTYRVGGALVQVSQPRIPCFKMNVRHERTDVLKEMIRTGYTGFYLRVLEEGTIQAGNSFTLIDRPAEAPSIAFANRIRHHERENQTGLEYLLKAEGLAAGWKSWLLKRLG
jgi:MOSC domain-containing protein YiiM